MTLWPLHSYRPLRAGESKLIMTWIHRPRFSYRLMRFDQGTVRQCFLAWVHLKLVVKR